MKLQRYAGNPILRPDPNHAWESLNVFNVGVIYHDDLFHMLYRAQGVDYVSRIGYAVSDDGFHWLRLHEPVFAPGNESETRGVEDPRITLLDDTFYMAYVAYSPHGIRAALARSRNLIYWERIGIALPDEDNKDHGLFPRRIGGTYRLFHRREPAIWLARSDDLLHWGDHQVVMQPREGMWDGFKVGIAGPPLEVEEGWLLIYHGVDDDVVYRLGVALLDREDPSRVLHRPADPILEPAETWEWKGDVPRVVFSCGQVLKDGILYVYYGGADRVVAVATCSLADLLAYCRSS